MPVGTFEYRNEAERIAMEQAVAYVAQMHDLALKVPLSEVLDVCEQQALGGGRALLQQTFQQAVQSRVDAAEEKKGRPVNARAGASSGSSAAAAGNC
jgi:hypothetical protein